VTQRFRARPLQGLLGGAAAALLVAGLLLAVVGRTVPANAGTVGSPYSAYVSFGPSEDVLSVSNPAGAPSTVASTASGYGATAINSTATLGVVTATLNDLSQAVIFNVPAHQMIGSIKFVYPVAYAMDPANPNVAFALTQAGSLYSLGLAAGAQNAPAPIANLNPTGIGGFSCSSLAITPDASHLIAGCTVNSLQSHVISISPTTGAEVDWSRAFRDYDLTDLVVAPNGSGVYATEASALLGQSVVFGLALGFTPTSNFALAPVVVGGANAPNGAVYANGLTITRDSSNLLVVGATTAGLGVIRKVSTSGAFAGETTLSAMARDANGNGGAVSVALSPDGGTAVVLGSDSTNATFIYAVGVAGLAAGPNILLATASSPVSDPEDVAITPDQAPAANLSPASGTAGVPVTLNASSSNIAYGQITSFAWNFGDGQTATTGGPTVSHTFASAGNFTVSVTETDAAGNSVPPAPGGVGAVNGPGTTAYLNASPSAQTSAPVAIGSPGAPPPPPPTTTTTSTGSTTPTTVKGSTPTTTKAPGKFQPTIHLVPSVGDPGTIVTVTGQGFPPGKNVTVSWSPGSGSFTETADLTGHLAPQTLYILIPDLLGSRQAHATVQGDPATAHASFLVVPGTAEPGRSGDVLFRSEGP
jgi:PKD domain